MRILQAFLILVTSAILWLLPVSSAVYQFKTDVRADTFSATTAAGVTSANVTLLKALYLDDTSTISFTSNETTDIPLASSYNSTNRQLLVSGLGGSLTRTLDVSYDVYALTGGGAIDTLVSRLDFIWLLALIMLPVAGLAAIFLGRV